MWTRPEMEIEARELRDVLDALTIVRVALHLESGEGPALSEPIDVEFTSRLGVKARYKVGIALDAAEGERVQIECEGRRAVLKDQKLQERLVAVLEKP